MHNITYIYYCSLGSPGTHSADQTCLEFTDICLPLLSAEIKGVHYHHPAVVFHLEVRHFEISPINLSKSTGVVII